MEKQFIIYGAGIRGKRIYNLLNLFGKKDAIYGYCDVQHKELTSVNEKKVYSYDEIKKLSGGYPFVISVGNKEEYKKIEQLLINDGKIIYAIDDLPPFLGIDRTEFNRALYADIYRNEQYYEKAESASSGDSIDTYWNEKKDFKQLFNKLDLSNVIELACGHGRHVLQYIDAAGLVTLVDINIENIEFCKKRFSDSKKIMYYCNNGYNLEKLEDNTYSSLFCYASMIQFELMDIYSYLKDIYRVLKSGGRALIHHSNFDMDYKASYLTNPELGGRKFMSKNLFAHIAWLTGFEIVEQRLIDWMIPKLDCISLIEKKKY